VALIACPGCDQNLSDEVGTCPHCGLSIDSRRTKVDYVTGEAIRYQPRPAARAARPPLRYPTPTGALMMVGGGLIVILGSFMPWVGPRQVSVSGMQGDGRATVVIGLLVVILGLSSRSSPSRLPRILVMIGSVLAIAAAAVHDGRLREGFSDSFIGAGVGTVVIGGSVAWPGPFYVIDTPLSGDRAAPPIGREAFHPSD